jgi:hypothetical protein
MSKRAAIKQELAQAQLKRQGLENALAHVKMLEADLKAELEADQIRFLEGDYVQGLRKHQKSTEQMLKTLNPKLSEMTFGFMNVRSVGEYANKGFFLGFEGEAGWKIVKDNMGASVLVPEVNL